MSEPTEREREAAGVPSNATLGLKIGGTASVLAIVGYLVIYRGFVASPIYAKKIARIDVPTMGEARSASVPATGAKKLLFVLSASRYSKSGYNEVLLDAEALRGGAPVAKVSCRTKTLKGNGSAVVVGSSSHDDDCDLALPTGGADAVRVSLRLKHPKNPATFEGLRLEVAAE